MQIGLHVLCGVSKLLPCMPNQTGQLRSGTKVDLRIRSGGLCPKRFYCHRPESRGGSGRCTAPSGTIPGIRLFPAGRVPRAGGTVYPGIPSQNPRRQRLYGNLQCLACRSLVPVPLRKRSGPPDIRAADGSAAITLPGAAASWRAAEAPFRSTPLLLPFLFYSPSLLFSKRRSSAAICARVTSAVGRRSPPLPSRIPLAAAHDTAFAAYPLTCPASEN